MSERQDRIERKLREALEPTHFEIVDESHLHAGHDGAKSGGGHFRVKIVSARFEGLSAVKRQQLVYGALQGEMGGEIHALSMETLAPEQWSAAGGAGG